MAKRATKAKPAEAAEPAETITAYKGFDKNFACRGHQFEVGQTYTVSGEIRVCENGFHACDNPFEVWSYYDVVDSRFAVVTLSGPVSRHGEDTKIAAASITVQAELTLPEFIKRGVDWLIAATKGKKVGSSGDYAKIGSSGHSAQIGSSGYYAKIGSSGYSAQIGSSGDSAQIGSSGYSAQIGSSGDYAKIGSSGDYAQIGSSGHSAQIGSSGDYAKIGSSGDYAKIGSSGHSAQIGSSGYYAKIEASGENAVIASAGPGTVFKGGVGALASLAEWRDGKCIGFATGCIGQDGLEPDTWYRASGGKLVPAETA